MTLLDPTIAQTPLLAWGEAHRRDLPWRHTRDPWSILVSEVMLQQTQVARVVPTWTAFLKRFPTPTACAAAPLADVVTAWAGMGYNRRAVALHSAAHAMVARHDGAVPDTLDELLALPGVGPYTARAVLVFAFEQHYGVVDTNAARVLARLRGRSLGTAEAQQAADEVAPRGAAWSWNQAVFDLGATVCTRRTPGCPACPVQRGCAWRAAGNPVPDPADGSAGVSRPQSRFAGSDRQGRGRLVDALRQGPVAGTRASLSVVMGWPGDPARAERVARRVVADGLAERDPSSGALRLPHAPDILPETSRGVGS